MFPYFGQKQLLIEFKEGNKKTPPQRSGALKYFMKRFYSLMKGRSCTFSELFNSIK